MNLTMKNGSVTIDGKSFTGTNIQIDGDKVVVDGVTAEGSLVGNINVVVNGDVDTLENTSGAVHVRDAGSVRTVSGNVICEDVTGNVKTVSGDVKATLIKGGVKTISGSINA